MMPPLRMRPRALGGRLGVCCLLAAAALLLSLELLRRAAPAVPDLVWLALVAGLLATGGTLVGGAALPARDDATRGRIARALLVVGAAALVVGTLSVTTVGERWSDDVRAAAALAWCAAFALLAAGRALRTSPRGRVPR